MHPYEMWLWDSTTAECRRPTTGAEVDQAMREFDEPGRRQVGHAVGKTQWASKPALFEISTAFMGYDLGSGRAPLPLLFETMVFRLDERGERALDVEQIRCTTAAEAVDVHASKVLEYLGVAASFGWGEIPVKAGLVALGPDEQPITERAAPDAAIEVARLGLALRAIGKIEP